MRFPTLRYFNMSFNSSVRTPCPVCGRTSSGCRVQGELLQCRIGTTFNPLNKHPHLKLGDIVGTWACVAINEDSDCVSFKVHEEPVVTKTTRFGYYNVHGDSITKTRLDYNTGKKEFKSERYRLDELLPYKYEALEGLPSGASVYVVEGERACDTMREYGYDTVALPGCSYKPRELELLRDKQLIWCPDRDRVGVELMMRWRDFYDGGLWLLAEPQNKPAWRDPSDGYDLADWLPDVTSMDIVLRAVQNDPPALPVAVWHERMDFGLDKLSNVSPYDLSLKMDEQLGDALRWNQLSDCVEMDGGNVEDIDLRLAYIPLHRLNVRIDKHQAVDAIVHSARQREYHPIVDYLDTCTDPLPDEMWANIGGEFLGGMPSEYDNSIVQRWLVHAVRRIYEPGSPFGVVLVLVGKQEAGKSRFFEELASRDWFNDGFKLSGKEADDVQKLTQSWIAEWGELDGGLKKTNEADIKAFVSRKVDRTREAYGQGTCMRKRGFVLCGTTNKESGFFSDETGNRRFALYQIGDGRIDGDKVAKWRDRIWASAVQAYKRGLSIHLSEMEQDTQRERNRFMFREDPWILKIDQYLLEHASTDFVTSTELLHNEYCIGAQIDRSTSYDLNRVKVALTAIGWIEGRKMLSGRKVRGFWRPGTTSNTGLVRSQSGAKD
jgi:predicted P-loop ATPase